ncbi:MAG: hypothetical protein ACKPKO_21050, partial [Candidatus Fonsibacter sp.]
MADDGYAMEQVAREFAYFQYRDLYVERKRHVRAERWLQVCKRCLVATMQTISLGNCNHPDPCQPATVSLTPAGVPEVIDIFVLALWPLLRTALREWYPSSDAGTRYLFAGNSTLVSERQWDVCSDTTLALIVFEALLKAGRLLSPTSQVPVVHHCSGNGPKLCLFSQPYHVEALLPVFANIGHFAQKRAWTF